MRHIQKQTDWNRNLSMAISVSMCTRVYMPEKRADLDEKCVDHIRRPNSTAAVSEPALMNRHRLVETVEMKWHDTRSARDCYLVSVSVVRETKREQQEGERSSSGGYLTASFSCSVL